MKMFFCILAIFFSFSLVTLLKEQDKIINCWVEAALFKCKEGTSYGQCYKRISAKLYRITNWKAFEIQSFGYLTEIRLYEKELEGTAIT